MTNPEVDVLLITTTKAEQDAALKMKGLERRDWDERRDRLDYRFFLRRFEFADVQPLTVALARPVGMGETPSAATATRLINELRPRCLAMSGLCAGRRGKVGLGDVVVASNVFNYETGKETPEGNDRLFDRETYVLDKRWKQDAEEFGTGWCEALVDLRPRSLESQEHWLLQQLYDHKSTGAGDPLSHPMRKQLCPNWTEAILRLRQRGHITSSGLEITEEGARQVQEWALLNPDGIPSDLPFAVHVAPMATGSAVVKNPKLFNRIELFSRNVLAVEMEANAIGFIAQIEGAVKFLIAKGVSDFGDEWKDDAFQEFAARMSAEFVLSFLCARLERARSTSIPTAADRHPLPPTSDPQSAGAPSRASALASRPVLILSAEGEDESAELLAVPLRRAGYEVSHPGTVLVGDSVQADVSRHLMAGAPIVVCATQKVVAFGLIYRVADAMRAYPGVRLFPVRMEKGLYLDTITWGSQTAEYWRDPAKALDDLVRALSLYYPVRSDSQGSVSATVSTSTRRRYLRVLAAMTRDLPLRGLDLKASDVEAQQDCAPCLTDVYIDLETLSRPKAPEGRGNRRAEPQLADEQAKPVSVLKAFGETRCMALLGDPGSGKSTFVNHLAHILARGQMEAESEAVTWPESLPETWRKMLPVRVILREMAAWLRSGEIVGKDVGLLESYLRYSLADSGQADFTGQILSECRAGNALLLLDGWDEVSAKGEALSRLRAMLETLPTAFPDCPMLVTCRSNSYSEAPWRLATSRWSEYKLLEFDDAKIDRFVVAWYRQLNTLGRAPTWQASTSKLQIAVRRPDLRHMAGNPLLLTIMALDHADKGELPDARSVVYEDVVDLLLWKWRQAKSEEDSSLSLRVLLQEAGCPERDFKRVLWQLAYDAHKGGAADDDGKRVADIPELTLRRHFAQLSEPPSWDRAEEFLRLMQFRTGLLIPSGPECYAFPHRTFQEYLAACHLCSLGDVVMEAFALTRAGVYWREVVLLAINRLAYQWGDTSRPFALMEALCHPTEGHSDGEDYWRQVALAGDCLAEIGSTVKMKAHEIEQATHVRARLASLVGSGKLNVAERAHAGSTLSVLGDPRDFGEMVMVPAGPFAMGSDKYSNESRHVVELDAYSIRKYPVTEQEYALFVTATGRSAPEHWRDNAPLRDSLNRPVVNVSWEDAVAYCEWLSKESGTPYSLPTEAQWEKAARGAEGWEYPWGNDWDESHCANSVGNNNLQDTVAVGSYPTGASPYACLDMAGNVWEWCSDWFDVDYYKTGPKRNPTGPAEGQYRVLRGGSWYYVHPDGFRAAFRYNFFPRDWIGFVGFRVALQGSV